MGRRGLSPRPVLTWLLRGWEVISGHRTVLAMLLSVTTSALSLSGPVFQSHASVVVQFYFSEPS